MKINFFKLFLWSTVLEQRYSQLLKPLKSNINVSSRFREPLVIQKTNRKPISICLRLEFHKLYHKRILNRNNWSNTLLFGIDLNNSLCRHRNTNLFLCGRKSTWLGTCICGFIIYSSKENKCFKFEWTCEVEHDMEVITCLFLRLYSGIWSRWLFSSGIEDGVFQWIDKFYTWKVASASWYFKFLKLGVLVSYKTDIVTN